jgi:hypothetical protein
VLELAQSTAHQHAILRWQRDGEPYVRSCSGGARKKDQDPKLESIREILATGEDVRYEIVRHGLTDKEAYEVESAVIDLFPDLLNDQVGHDAEERGRMSLADGWQSMEPSQLTPSNRT